MSSYMEQKQWPHNRLDDMVVRHIININDRFHGNHTINHNVIFNVLREMQEP
jgi:hypothetical protein